MIPYQPSNLDFRPIFSKECLNKLHAFSDDIPLNKFMESPNNAEGLMTEYIYATAKIEGNTYTEAEVETLLKTGNTAAGKSITDALMILGMKKAYDYVMLTKPGDSVGYSEIMQVHSYAMIQLLNQKDVGTIRDVEVAITGSKYSQSFDVTTLTSDLHRIAETSLKYNDPFERAAYLHCNIAYLQPFIDGNKRTARFMQMMSMIASGITPLFIRKEHIQNYRDAIIAYYKFGKYDKYEAFFLDTYKANRDTLHPCLYGDEPDTAPVPA
jgi:Fic family protein